MSTHIKTLLYTFTIVQGTHKPKTAQHQMCFSAEKQTPGCRVNDNSACRA